MLSSVEIVLAVAPEVILQTTKDAWTWIYAVGIGAFYLSVLFLVPLGCYDLFAFFSDLNAAEESDTD